MNPERRRDGYRPTVHRSVYLPNCPLLLFCVDRSTVKVRSNAAQVFVIASVNFRVMPRPGPSDRLSEQYRHALEADLRAYILQMRESSTPLWCFGVYGNTFEDGCRGSLAEIHAQCQGDRQLLGWHYAEDLLLDEADEYVQVYGCHVHCLVVRSSAPLHEPRARLGDVSRAVSVSREQAV